MELTGLLLFIAGLALMAAGVVLGDGMQDPEADKPWTVAAGSRFQAGDLLP